MADRPDQDDPSERTSTYSFRRKLSEGLTGLLDPDGALGKGRDYVSGFAQGTKSELVRIFATEVRSFLDNMDSVEMLQRVIAGLVIEVKTEIRFSLDKEGKLQPTMTTRESKVSQPAAAPSPAAAADDVDAADDAATPTPTPGPGPGPEGGPGAGKRRAAR
ncbi:MAG: hypothetical protein KC420_14155 [Myxococcales bacterium]|nr:hypothetical protein [Myxococcales bacterium]MCB9566140.1 hypothetical protein [Myxococcales bacterium]